MAAGRRWHGGGGGRTHVEAGRHVVHGVAPGRQAGRQAGRYVSLFVSAVKGQAGSAGRGTFLPIVGRQAGIWWSVVVAFTTCTTARQAEKKPNAGDHPRLALSKGGA